MSYDFADAAPVKAVGGGRKAAPNPFTDVIKAIALKTVREGDKDVPVAKAFTETHEKGDDVRKKVIARIKRQMSEAGEKNDPQVTVNVNAVPATGKDAATKTLVTFWTVKRQSRPRKPKAETTPATGTQTASPQASA